MLFIGIVPTNITNRPYNGSVVLWRSTPQLQQDEGIKNLGAPAYPEGSPRSASVKRGG